MKQPLPHSSNILWLSSVLFHSPVRNSTVTLPKLSTCRHHQVPFYYILTNLCYFLLHLFYPHASAPVNPFPHLFVLCIFAFVSCWVGCVSSRVGEGLCLGPQRQGQRGHQRWLHLAEDLGAEAEAVGEFCMAWCLKVTGQSRHHSQQQLREMLRLDFYVRLLKRLKEEKVSTGKETDWSPFEAQINNVEF